MKSRNKIFSFFFLLIFLVSNTGLPLSLHICQMMKSISIDACDMHQTMKVKKSCCSNISGELISSGRASCCETKIAAEPLKDRYISAKEDVDGKVIDIIPITGIVLITDEINEFEYNEINASPPYYQNQVLYILNSSFLI